MLTMTNLSAARASSHASSDHGLPIHGVVGVLQQVWAGFTDEGVGM